jgi:hypothetical protein
MWFYGGQQRKKWQIWYPKDQSESLDWSIRTNSNFFTRTWVSFYTMNEFSTTRNKRTNSNKLEIYRLRNCLFSCCTLEPHTHRPQMQCSVTSVSISSSLWRSSHRGVLTSKHKGWLPDCLAPVGSAQFKHGKGRVRYMEHTPGQQGDDSQSMAMSMWEWPCNS